MLLGQALDDPAMTSAGVMGYTMESKAVEQQWFDNAPGSSDPDGTAFPSTFADLTKGERPIQLFRSLHEARTWLERARKIPPQRQAG